MILDKDFPQEKQQNPHSAHNTASDLIGKKIVGIQFMEDRRMKLFLEDQQTAEIIWSEGNIENQASD